MHQNAIMEGSWIFQDSKYVRFLLMQVLHKILNIPEYGLILPYGRVLNMPGHRFTILNKSRVLNVPGLGIFDGYTGCWIYLNKSEYALIMSQWVNMEYVGICLKKTALNMPNYS